MGRDSTLHALQLNPGGSSRASQPKGGLYHFFRNLYIFFVTSHNFFSLSSVQIIIIPACCLLCVL